MRNTMTLSMLATGVALLLPASATAQFEGVITVVMHQKQEGDMTMVQWSKGNKFRADMTRPSKGGEGPGNATMIFDRDAMTSTMVMHDRRMYMTGPIPDLKARAPDKGGKDDGADVTWTKTGRTETVAGVSCDIYHGTTVKDGKRTESDLCLAKGVGFLASRMSGSGPMGGGVMERFTRNLGAPADAGIMKVTTYEDGKPRIELEVTKVERRTLTDGDFKPPTGYQKFEMPGRPGAGAPPRP